MESMMAMMQQGSSVSVQQGSSDDGSMSDDRHRRVVQRRVSRSDGVVLSDGRDVVRQSWLDPVVAREARCRIGCCPWSGDQRVSWCQEGSVSMSQQRRSVQMGCTGSRQQRKQDDHRLHG